MYCVQNISDDVYYVGSSDRRLSLFENAFPIPNGVSYNAYLLLDEKTVLVDTVDASVSKVFFENIKHVLDGRELDYVIVNHMEPDHCATLEELVRRYPSITIVGNCKTFTIMKQFFDFEIEKRAFVVKEGDTLSTGKHNFAFFMAPMVHWPEAMVSYDSYEKMLFSADAFGTFGALNGNIFADEMNFERDMIDEARRYYTNIVGKYGMQTVNLLKKASSLDIEYLCPLHGPVWRSASSNIQWYIDKYKKWGSYEAEGSSIVIAYASIYGNTENAAQILATELSKRGIKNIKMYDTSITHPSYILSECFRVSHIVFASSTYNGGIFSTMETLLHDVKAHNLQNKTIACIENGTWAAQSGKQMKAILETLKNVTILENLPSLKSSVKNSTLDALKSLADDIVASF